MGNVRLIIYAAAVGQKNTRTTSIYEKDLWPVRSFSGVSSTYPPVAIPSRSVITLLNFSVQLSCSPQGPEINGQQNLENTLSTNYKIIWIVRGFWLVCKWVFVALWSTKMTWAMWLIVYELWEFTLRASYTVFLFVKTENNFIKEIKHVVRAFIASTASRVFTDLLSNSPKRLPRFSPGSESTENMFYFLIKWELSMGYVTEKYEEVKLIAQGITMRDQN